MRRVVRRRTTTVRITWIEQTLTDSIEETSLTPATVLAPPVKTACVRPRRPACHRKTPVKPPEILADCRERSR